MSADPEVAAAADALVLPGVGAFASCVEGLRAMGGATIVADHLRALRPVLGICVGMQVLFTEGDEHGVRTDGLGLLPGSVRRLHAPVLPHMGWNTVEASTGSKLFAGIDAETRFYFVHSYAAAHTSGLVTWAEHGERFAAAVEDGLISATQFHPEKSGDAGSALLENWLATV